MLEIVLATRNKDKVKEIKRILTHLKVKILSIGDFPNMPGVEEDRKTLRGNAIKKAKETAKYTNKISLADDSGLQVYALNRKPGVTSARFAGKDCNYKDNNKKLLKLMKNKKNRKALFKCVMAITVPKGKTKTVTGTIIGTISTKSRGKHGFGYDPVFIVPQYNKTFAELGLSIKNKISHRAKALQKIRKILQEMT